MFSEYQVMELLDLFGPGYFCEIKPACFPNLIIRIFCGKPCKYIRPEKIQHRTKWAFAHRSEPLKDPVQGWRALAVFPCFDRTFRNAQSHAHRLSAQFSTGSAAGEEVAATVCVLNDAVKKQLAATPF